MVAALFDRRRPDAENPPIDQSSPRAEKVRVFRSLFAGRDDVYAQRWENSRTGKAGWTPAVRGGWRNARQPDRECLPLTKEVTERHLAGDVHAGLYPLLRGDACRLLVADFDGATWVLDALAYLDAASTLSRPSRSDPRPCRTRGCVANALARGQHA